MICFYEVSAFFWRSKRTWCRDSFFNGTNLLRSIKTTTYRLSFCHLENPERERVCVCGMSTLMVFKLTTLTAIPGTGSGSMPSEGGLTVQHARVTAGRTLESKHFKSPLYCMNIAWNGLGLACKHSHVSTCHLTHIMGGSCVRLKYELLMECWICG